MNLSSTTYGAVSDQMSRGARFVRFPMVVSLLVVSVTLRSRTHFIAPGKTTLGVAWPYLLATLLFGWWSPKGFINTFKALSTFSGGGEDVSYDILTALDGARPAGERVDRPRYV